jgi:hypothetical protein
VALATRRRAARWHPGRPGSRDPRSQTVATWLALLGGASAFIASTCTASATPRLAALAADAPRRLWRQPMRDLGQDDRIAWVLIPALGLVLAATR